MDASMNRVRHCVGVEGGREVLDSGLDVQNKRDEWKWLDIYLNVVHLFFLFSLNTNPVEIYLKYLFYL